MSLILAALTRRRTRLKAHCSTAQLGAHPGALTAAPSGLSSAAMAATELDDCARCRRSCPAAREKLLASEGILNEIHMIYSPRPLCPSHEKPIWYYNGIPGTIMEDWEVSASAEDEPESPTGHYNIDEVRSCSKVCLHAGRKLHGPTLTSSNDCAEAQMKLTLDEGQAEIDDVRTRVDRAQQLRDQARALEAEAAALLSTSLPTGHRSPTAYSSRSRGADPGNPTTPMRLVTPTAQGAHSRLHAESGEEDSARVHVPQPAAPPVPTPPASSAAGSVSATGGAGYLAAPIPQRGSSIFAYFGADEGTSSAFLSPRKLDPPLRSAEWREARIEPHRGDLMGARAEGGAEQELAGVALPAAEGKTTTARQMYSPDTDQGSAGKPGPRAKWQHPGACSTYEGLNFDPFDFGASFSPLHQGGRDPNLLSATSIASLRGTHGAPHNSETHDQLAQQWPGRLQPSSSAAAESAGAAGQGSETAQARTDRSPTASPSPRGGRLVNRPLLGQGQQRAVLEMRHSSAQVQQKREGAEHRASLERGSLGLHADQGSDRASHPSPAISSAPTSPASPALLRDARRTSPAASGSLNRSRSPVMEASPAFGSHASKIVQHGEEAKRAPRDAMVAAKEAGSAAASLQGLAHYYRSRPVPFVCAITLVKGQRARGAACCSCCMPCLSCAREHA